MNEKSILLLEIILEYFRKLCIIEKGQRRVKNVKNPLFSEVFNDLNKSQTLLNIEDILCIRKIYTIKFKTILTFC